MSNEVHFQLLRVVVFLLLHDFTRNFHFQRSFIKFRHEGNTEIIFPSPKVVPEGSTFSLFSLYFVSKSTSGHVINNNI